MKKLYTLIILIAISSQFINAQVKKKTFGFKIKGFVKNEIIYDTRQTVTSRDGTVLLFPSPVSKDDNGKDINADPQFNLVALTTRLQGVISGPDALGAKTSGMISCDFVGTGNDKVVLPRLRQAFIKLSWEKSTLLLGKAWHPLFVTEVFPQLLTFGAGIPCYTLNRAPQVTYTIKGKNLNLTLSATTQDDFKTIGPAGRSCSYLVNSGKPEFNGRLMYKSKKFIIGAAAGFWSVKPSLTNKDGQKTDATASGYLVNSFTKLSLDKLTLRGGYLVGENASQLMMFGGFGEASIDSNGEVDYTSTKGSSLWGDMNINCNHWSLGLFTGYTKNHGSDKEITGNIYALAPNIANYLRVAPRVSYTSGKIKIGIEAVYHSADYGTPDEKYVVKNTTKSDALRLLTSVIYAF